ncbi:Ger(x)C family spore germination protein [Paenibacillus vulneris]|uniref:Ger(X)C family spore germination protein n=1 Tax=Paenibacillus vulneris TaxID=1133364 RepID=A0ABW3UI17_9BACL
MVSKWASSWICACKWLTFAMVVTALLLSTGCWDRKEVNDLAIVTIAGIDRKDNGEIELTVEIVVPKQEGGKTQISGNASKESGPTLIWSASGATVADAVSKLQRKLSRAIYWGQLELLVVGEALSRDRFREQLDYIVRDNNIRLRVQPFVCKGAVSDFLASASPLEQTKADFLGGEADRVFHRSITLNLLVQGLGKNTQSAMLPYLDITQEGNKSIPYVKGYAVFSRERMAGVIQGDSFSGAKWILHQVKGDVETVKMRKPISSLISIGILSSSTQLVTELQEGMPRIEVGIEAEVNVVQNTTRFKTSDPNFIRQVEKSASDDIRRNVETAIKQSQEMGADIFGFGEVINRRYPGEWQQLQDRWDMIFPSMQVKVEVKVNVRHIGMYNEPTG